jgi:tetratricopeptide (TPR) repeat protein
MTTQPASPADDRQRPEADAAAEPTSGTVDPMAGGRWQPVTFEELLRRDRELIRQAHGSTETETETADAGKPSDIRLERRQELEQHLRASPTDLDSYLELAAIYRAEDRPIEARRVLQQAIQIFPDDQTLLWEFEEATLARSLQQLREVTELARRLETLETERELKRCQNDWACRRMDVCNARLKRDPSLIHLRVALAEAMFDAELYEPAIDEVEAVLKEDELAPQAHLIRARCQLALGQDVQALSSLRAVSMRRAVVAPPRIRVAALRLLCHTAERLGVEATLKIYRQALLDAEKQLAAQHPRATQTSNAAAPGGHGAHGGHGHHGGHR